MSRPPKYDDTLIPELPGRPGYEVTEHSRFEDPDAKPFDYRRPRLRADGTHDGGCPCDECRCPKCDRLGGRTDCSTCRILAAPPHVHGPNYVKDDAPDYNPQKPEGWPVIRYNGQRIGDPVYVKPTCAKCGHQIFLNLRKVGDTYECTNTHACESMVRVGARLRLVKVEQP